MAPEICEALPFPLPLPDAFAALPLPDAFAALPLPDAFAALAALPFPLPGAAVLCAGAATGRAPGGAVATAVLVALFPLPFFPFPFAGC